ncbi:MAG: CoA pyrophosphatase [Proteobacteria bacterium]|nr:CoA pyrophosphatase [Pseudomonadota bacterium]MBI3497589.1 CoA pyrophosphatase [Pseudomonadota bacterium]
MEQKHLLAPGQPRSSELSPDLAALRRAFIPRPGNEAARRGDNDLNFDMALPANLRKAAVLVPLVQRPGGMTVLLTRRTDHLPDHPGQISFPGGRIEASDASPEAGALREALEEIGLPAERVEILGRLDIYRTRTGFEITPVVGVVSPPFELVPDSHEVAEVFEVPFAFVMDTANHQRHSREWNGQLRTFYVLPYAHYHIWGATAGMLVNLAERLRL